VALKVGTEDRKKVAIAGALGLVVLLLAAKTIFGGPDTPAPAPAPAANPVPVSALPAASSTHSGGGPAATSAGSAATQLDPTLHPELMAENESFTYQGTGRNIFQAGSVAAPSAAAVKIEKVRGPIRPVNVAAAVPSGPPPPPPINLRFFGFAARRDGSRQAFLLHGDDVFVASVGDVVSHRYRVVSIAPASIQVEDLPFHNTQSLPLVQ
jgi:hypothetical protein